jgi:hypothetical protein
MRYCDIALFEKKKKILDNKITRYIIKKKEDLLYEIDR